MIYSLHVLNTSRAAGSSAVVSCSYITPYRMRDKHTGEAFDRFDRKERVKHVCMILSEGAPDGYLDPKCLFNAVEAARRRSDVRLTRKIMVVLLHELGTHEHFRALEDFIS